MALKTAWCTDGRHTEQDHHGTISLVGLGPDVATWLAYSSHSSWAGARNQSGVHKPLFYEPHLATSFNRPDGTPAGEMSSYGLHVTVATWIYRRAESSLGHSCFLLIVLSSPLPQTHRDPEAKKVFQEWQNEREELRWVPSSSLHPTSKPSRPSYYHTDTC